MKRTLLNRIIVLLNLVILVAIALSSTSSSAQKIENKTFSKVIIYGDDGTEASGNVNMTFNIDFDEGTFSSMTSYNTVTTVDRSSGYILGYELYKSYIQILVTETRNESVYYYQITYLPTYDILTIVDVGTTAIFFNEHSLDTTIVSPIGKEELVHSREY